MVYHRLPFAEMRKGGKTYRRRHRSPNGIIPTLLDFFSDGTRGSWVASSEQESRSEDGCAIHEKVDEESYPNLTVARVPLTRQDIHLFYERFSKEALWPVIFSFPGKAVFKPKMWNHYVEVNRLFADRTAREAAKGGTVWVHDYNLWLVPGMLRQRRPDVKNRLLPPHGVPALGHLQHHPLAPRDPRQPPRVRLRRVPHPEVRRELRRLRAQPRAR